MLTMTINVETNSHKIVFLSYFSLLFLYLLLFIIIVSSFILKNVLILCWRSTCCHSTYFDKMPSNPQQELKSSHLSFKNKIKINLNDLSTYYLFILSCSTFFFCSSVRISTKRENNFFIYIFVWCHFCYGNIVN